MTSDANPHLGTALDDLLAEDGTLGSVGASRVSGGWHEQDRSPFSQVTQSGYEVYVSQRVGPLELVTDGNACALGAYAIEWGGHAAWSIVLGRLYLNFEPRTPSDLYVVYRAASSSVRLSQELCVNRMARVGTPST